MKSLTQTQRDAGTELGPDGRWPIGRDPRRMSQDELRTMGHQPMPVLAALRARCLDCCANKAGEVRKCISLSCPAWPFRMGTNPWRPSASEAQRAQGRRLGTRMQQKSAATLSFNGPAVEEPGAATPVALPERRGETV